MGVDETSLDRIRNATFPTSRRGYDKHEVEKFLARLADWLETGGGDDSRSETVKRELERVGERTGAILSQAEESAQQIRSEAEQLAREVTVESTAVAQKARTEADAYAEKTRREADVYANETRRDTDEEVAEIRTEAEEEARETITEAQAQAARLVEAGTRRRQDLQAVIADLLRRRDEVLEDIEELSSRLRSIVGEQRPAEAEEVTEAYDVADALDATAREGDDVPGEAGPDDPADEAAPEEASKPNPNRSRKVGY
ncbi:MAG TPA: DivIVA domain-containing protein [Solirubrobacterales bacterium]|jgi:DivIVA domain-containing protein|nr:DivIVA domain-containing protein [Solirubrobacterales bacterium]